MKRIFNSMVCLFHGHHDTSGNFTLKNISQIRLETGVHSQNTRYNMWVHLKLIYTLCDLVNIFENSDW